MRGAQGVMSFGFFVSLLLLAFVMMLLFLETAYQLQNLQRRVGQLEQQVQVTK